MPPEAIRAIIRCSLLILCAVSAALAGDASAHNAGAPAITLPADRIGNVNTAGFNEPSGACFHPGRKSFFIVGDEGDICEIKPDGTFVRQKHIRHADFEGVTVDPATGRLYIAAEGTEEILELDAGSLTVRRTFTVPRELNGETVMKAGGQGIEGITFVPDEHHPEGGTFFVVNQSFDLRNTHDRSAVFELELPLRHEKKRPRLLRMFEPGVIDLSAVSFDRTTGNLFVIADTLNILMEITRSFKIRRTWALPGKDQEGIAFAGDRLCIAQDSGGIILYRHRLFAARHADGTPSQP